MRPLIARLDRLQRLALFESAARLGSFTSAGHELGIAQPAVTRQIRALERSVGVELFRRTANRSELSAAGRELLEAVDVGFATIEQRLDAIDHAGHTFVLASPPGFAQEILVPYLDALQDVLGDRDLRLWLYDREGDLATGHFDAAIRIGLGDWDGLDCASLFDERVVPVATGEVAAAWHLDASSSAAEVLTAPLLHMDAIDRPWLSWSDWLAHFGLSLTPSRRRVIYNNYPTVLQQAVAGRGVALGWIGLVDRHIRDEMLVVVGPTLDTDRAYYVTWPSGVVGPAAELPAWLRDHSSIDIASRTTAQ